MATRIQIVPVPEIEKEPRRATRVIEQNFASLKDSLERAIQTGDLVKGGTTYSADATGTVPAPTVVGLHGIPLDAPVAGDDGKALVYDHGNALYEWIALLTDHGLLTGLGDDDHTLYLLASGLREWDEQGGDPSTPSTGKWKLYFKSGGAYIIDDAGAVTGPLGAGGGGYTDPLTTKGDLVGRSGAATIRVGVGTDGHVVTADAASTPGWKWAAAGGGSSGAWPFNAGKMWPCADVHFYGGTWWYQRGQRAPIILQATDGGGYLDANFDDTQMGNYVADQVVTANAAFGYYSYGGNNFEPPWGTIRHYFGVAMHHYYYANLTFWMGFSQTVPNNAANAWPWSSPSTKRAIGFHYRDGTDTNWQCISSAGTAADTYAKTDSGVAFDNTAWHTFEFKKYDDGATPTVKFYIDGALVATHTTEIPVQVDATRVYYYVVGIPQNTTPTTANARYFISTLLWFVGGAGLDWADTAEAL